MSYNDDFSVNSFLPGLMKKYYENRNVFDLIYPIYVIFTNRPDWPHCFDEFNKASEQLLGDSIMTIVFGFTSRYLHDEQMKWPPKWIEEGIVEDFVNKLKLLHITFNDIVHQYGFGRIHPLKLFSITETKNEYEKYYILKMTRFDGTNFEFQVSFNEIDFIINAFEGLRINE